MKTKVKNYTDEQLLNRVSLLPSFIDIPKEYWILGVQSNEDIYNEFDDKFYIYKGEKFIKVTSGTTNTGKSGLKNYKKYNSKGVAVIKTDEWYYELWKYGLHRGKMQALVQNKNIEYYRDYNKNNKAEEIGIAYKGKIGINFHTVSYEKDLHYSKNFIDGWSVGCQVINHVGDYYDILDMVKHQDSIDYCLIKEF